MNRMGFGRYHRVTLRRTLPVAVTSLLAVVAITAVENRTVHAGTPNSVVQWNVIAEEAVIRLRAFQSEGFLYMAYVSAAVYDAVVAIEGRYVPYLDGVATAPGASTDAAVIEAAYRTLVHYFPGQTSILEPQVHRCAQRRLGRDREDAGPARGRERSESSSASARTTDA